MITHQQVQCVQYNIKIALRYSVYLRTSGEKVRISDEAERVQSVSYSHIRSLSGSVQSPRVVCGGLSHPKQISKPPQIETWNTINQWIFCQFLECQAPPQQSKSPTENFLATVLVIVIYTIVCLREDKRGTCLGMCKVSCFQKGPTVTAMYKYSKLLCFQRGPQQQL